MSTSSGSRDYGRFDELAEEFAARFRRGERPSLQEYVDRCPEMADEIREMFPAMVEVEQADDDVRGEASPPPAVAPRLSQVGDYRILREIGRGGMGVVYEAEQISLGRRVALKVLPGHAIGDRKALERFRREAKAAARMHHTNIVPVFEVGRESEFAFYAMQLIQGQGLDQVIDELKRLRAPGRRPDGHGPASNELPSDLANVTRAGSAASILRKRETRDEKARDEKAFDAAIRKIATAHAIPAADPRREELIAQIDLASAEQMRAILHWPAFQSLEASWRSLFFFFAISKPASI